MVKSKPLHDARSAVGRFEIDHEMLLYLMRICNSKYNRPKEIKILYAAKKLNISYMCARRSINRLVEKGFFEKFISWKHEKNIYRKVMWLRRPVNLTCG